MDKMHFREIIRQRLYDLAKEQVEDLRAESIGSEENYSDAVEIYTEAKHSAAHPGFKAVAAKIARKEGYSKERASAILAASSRHASKAAKKKNPRLKKV